MLRQKLKLPVSKENFISMISGTGAGIATTAAIIAGLTVGTTDRNIVVISAIIAVTVQAFNSALTTIITSHTLDEIEHNRDMDSLMHPLSLAGLQFLTHITAGMVVLLPMVYVTRLEIALLCSIAIALLMLFWLGFYVGRIVQHTPLRNSVQSFILGIMIILGGFAAGYIIN